MKKTANLIATDLDKDIFQRARQIMLGNTDDVVKLEFKGEKTPDELRKEIMDTTKQKSGITTPQSSSAQTKPSVTPSGSRSALMEQLQILGNIPNDREIEDRLKTIQKQIAEIKKKEDDDKTLHSPVALKSFMFGEKGKELVAPKARTATYSVAPTQYNVDPYREVTEE
jgi:tRNA(Ser,Leu) C12 N-acetylase TAN1